MYTRECFRYKILDIAELNFWYIFIRPTRKVDLRGLQWNFPYNLNISNGHISFKNVYLELIFRTCPRHCWCINLWFKFHKYLAFYMLERLKHKKGQTDVGQWHKNSMSALYLWFISIISFKTRSPTAAWHLIQTLLKLVNGNK